MITAAIALTFVLTLTMVLGSYWMFVTRHELAHERSLQKRLQLSGAGVFVQPSFVAVPRPLSAIGPLNTVLTWGRGLVMPLQRLLQQAGVSLTPGAVILASVLCALVAGVVVSSVTARFSLVAGAAALAATLPVVYLRRMRRRRIAAFEVQFPNAIDLIARSLRAGHAFSTALELAGSEIGDPVGSEFRRVFERQNYGMSLEEALKSFAIDVPLIDARFFVTAVLTQREVGGNLAEVLDSLSAVIRERFRVRRQVRIVSAHGRITAVVLALLPVVVAAVLWIMEPDHIALLLNDPAGPPMLITAVVLQIVGYLIMRRIINIEY